MILSMAVVMIPMHIRFVVCGELTIPHLGLIYYCFYKRKIAMRNLGRPSRSDFVQSAFIRYRIKADTCYLPYITENGQRRRVYCIMIIDDHSRFLVGSGLFYNDNAYNFQKVLGDAGPPMGSQPGCMWTMAAVIPMNSSPSSAAPSALSFCIRRFGTALPKPRSRDSSGR